MALGAKVSSTARSATFFKSGGNVSPDFQLGVREKLIACALWDDSLDGHLPIQVSNGGMGLGVFLPKQSFVTHNFNNVLVVPVGPTNMFASLEADFDLDASNAISGAPWSTTGLKQGAVVPGDTTAEEFTTQVGTATGFGTTTFREIQLCATVAVSSAGRIAMYVEYVVVPPAAQGNS
jgi:hypothetical protein